jgi:tetratricopeptide (TPR) repeat protein
METIFSYLNEFTPTSLSITAKEIRDGIVNKINAKKFMIANQWVKRIKEFANKSKVTREKMEIWAECGLAHFQMGDPYLCIESLKQALSNCAPGSHEQAILHWMLGEAQLKEETLHFDAFKTWELALEELNALAVVADRRNKIPERDWYRIAFRNLEAALRTRAAFEVT